MRILRVEAIDKILVLTKGVFKIRELWIKETPVSESRWQPAHTVREVVTTGGRVICSLSPDGINIVPAEYARKKFPGDTQELNKKNYGLREVRMERMDDHLYRARTAVKTIRIKI